VNNNKELQEEFHNFLFFYADIKAKAEEGAPWVVYR
jgi:hypothetical protein